MSRLAAAVAAPLAVLVAALLAPTATAADEEAGGRLHGDKERLKQGCHVYTYDYRVRVPYDDWTLETEVIGPGGDSLHAGAFFGKPGRQADPRRKRNIRFEICRNTTRPGRFKITGKLTYYEKPGGFVQEHLEEPDNGTVVRLPVERFRLRR